MDIQLVGSLRQLAVSGRAAACMDILVPGYSAAIRSRARTTSGCGCDPEPSEPSVSAMNSIALGELT